MAKAQGVSEIASVGGFVKQYSVVIDPRRLQALGIPLSRIRDVIRESNMDVGGRTVEVGFAFLTLAIATGMLWNMSRGPLWTSTPKEWSALAAWFIYVALLVARHRSGWGGRRAALLGIAGFVIVVFTFFSLSLVRGIGSAA